MMQTDQTGPSKQLKLAILALIILFIAIVIFLKLPSDFKSKLLGQSYQETTKEGGKVDEIKGTLTFVHADSFDMKTSTDEYFVISGENQYKIDEEKVNKIVGSNRNPSEFIEIDIKGTKIDENNKIIDFDSANVVSRKIIPGPIPDPSPSYPIQKKVAVILFNFSNDTSQTYSPAQAKQYVFTYSSNNPMAVNGYYHEASFNKLNLTGHINRAGDVFGWYTIPSDNTNCSYPGDIKIWAQQAIDKAAMNGYNPSNYDVTSLIFPRVNACYWGGLFTYHALNYNGSTVYSIPFTYSNTGWPPNITHEIGHAMGLNHADSQDCYDLLGKRVSYPFDLPYGCKVLNYGNPFDIMGSGYRHLNSVNKYKLGLFSPPNIKTVTTAGFYNIYPIETNDSNVKTLRIPYNNGFQSGTWVLEFRQPYGVWDNFSNTDPVVNGVTVLKELNGSSYLIDTHPSTVTYDDAPLGAGESFGEQDMSQDSVVSSKKNNFYVTFRGLVKKNGNTYAQVYVNPGDINNCVLGNPTFSINIPNPIVSGNLALLNLPISIPFTYTNNDSQGCLPTYLEPRVTTYSGGDKAYFSILDKTNYDIYLQSDPEKIKVTPSVVYPRETINGTINLSLSGMLPCSILPNNNSMLFNFVVIPFMHQNSASGISNKPITLNYNPLPTSPNLPPLVGDCY